MEPVVMSALVTGGCAIGAATVAGLFSHAAGKRAGKTEFVTAVQEAAALVIKNLREQIEHLTNRCEAAERRCEDAEGHHRACRNELDELWAEVRKKPVPPYVDPQPMPRKRRRQ